MERETAVADTDVGAVVMDLSKAIDCFPHDLVIAKLAAYRTERENLRLIYSTMYYWTMYKDN